MKNYESIFQSYAFNSNFFYKRYKKIQVATELFDLNQLSTSDTISQKKKKNVIQPFLYYSSMCPSKNETKTCNSSCVSIFIIIIS